MATGQVVVANHVEGDLIGSRGVHSDPDQIVPVRPVALVPAGTDEGFHEAPVPVQTVAAGQEDGLGGAGIGSRGKPLPPGLKALGEGHVDVGRPEIGRRPVGVEVLGGGSSKIDPMGHVPVDEVLRRGELEAAVAVVVRRPGRVVEGERVRADSPVRVAEEDAVASPVRVPEGHVEGVEGVPVEPLPNQRLLALQLGPAKPVGRDQRDQRITASPQRLVALGVGSRRIAVLEDTHAVGDRLVSRLVQPDDGVFPGTLELVQPQRGTLPDDAVAALGVANGIGMVFDLFFAGLQQSRVHVFGVVASPEVHAQPVVILDDADVETSIPFPGPVEDEDLACRAWAVELQFDSRRPLDEEVVHEKFEP